MNRCDLGDVILKYWDVQPVMLPGTTGSDWDPYFGFWWNLLIAYQLLLTKSWGWCLTVWGGGYMLLKHSPPF